MDITALREQVQRVPGDNVRVTRSQVRSLVLKSVFLLFYPEGANRKNLPPKVPITPLPRYSLMETPELRKELDRLVLPWKVCS